MKSAYGPDPGDAAAAGRSPRGTQGRIGPGQIVPDITAGEPDRLLPSFINGIKRLPCQSG